MFRSEILQLINSEHKCYWNVNQVASRVNCSTATARKWLKVLFQEKAIKRCNIGIYSPSYVYIKKEVKTGDIIELP